MTTMLVWLLISVSAGYGNHGVTTNIAMFKDASQCEYVLKNIPSDQVKAKCIQAEILVPK